MTTREQRQEIRKHVTSIRDRMCPPHSGAMSEQNAEWTLLQIDSLLSDCEEMENSWRCFHCEEVFTDKASAEEHFGLDREEWPAACVDPLRTDEKERQAAFVSAFKEMEAAQEECERLRAQVEQLEHTTEGQQAAIHSYKPFRECNSINDVFFVYDSIEGRALSAEEKLTALEQENAALKLLRETGKEWLTRVEEQAAYIGKLEQENERLRNLIDKQAESLNFGM